MKKLDWSEINGWFSEADAKFVLDILKDIRNGTVVEIGLFYGRSSAVMMPIALKNANQYFAIDNFFGGIDEKTPASIIQRAEGKKVKQTFIDNMRLIGIDRASYQLWEYNSIDASVFFSDESVDFCFIDGDHAYESVKKDIEVWWKKIKKNGMLGGHDSQNRDVHKAMVEFITSNGLIANYNGNCWSVKKHGE